MGRLEGRKAIVTGAASGIGRASAELFAAEGARVLAVDRPGSNLAFEHSGIDVLGVDLAEDASPKAILRWTCSAASTSCSTTLASLRTPWSPR